MGCASVCRLICPKSIPRYGHRGALFRKRHSERRPSTAQLKHASIDEQLSASPLPLLFAKTTPNLTDVGELSGNILRRKNSVPILRGSRQSSITIPLFPPASAL